MIHSTSPGNSGYKSIVYVVVAYYPDDDKFVSKYYSCNIRKSS